MVKSVSKYRGRIAPSPTGFLHLGHAQTFWKAHSRAIEARGVLVFRSEDIDVARCRPEFAAAAIEDLRWLGCEWQEGPDVGGLFAPYVQSERRARYICVFEKLRANGAIYPCECSRRDVEQSASAPHENSDAGWQQDEPIYSGKCRPASLGAAAISNVARAGVNWRFRVPDGRRMEFLDGGVGMRSATAGAHFGDFLVWRKDDWPSYQLAVVVDDIEMQITEVVRGADLLLSTFRQLLLFEALCVAAPAFFHCPLVLDENGKRLAKRHEALALRQLRDSGFSPEAIRSRLV